MKNKDTHEWLLDEGIDSLTTIVDMKGESVFIVDILEKYLKEQLIQTTVTSTACNKYTEGINMQCARCDEPKYKH